MNASDPRYWMWSEALDMLARAEHMQRQLFQPSRRPTQPSACWEPPADMFETEHEVTVITALPGVDPATVTVTLKNGVLEIFGRRALPKQLEAATIHRLELPQGCFQRQVHIPPGEYDDIHRSGANGCLVVTLRKHPGR
jgi:HSP20 family molecular chaperone IbpA